jgi:D-xylose transport system permease protein
MAETIAKSRDRGSGFNFDIKKYSMFIALIIICMVFTILTGGTFLTPRNLSNVFLQTSYIAILACGMVLVIVAGHIDLSVGSVAGFTGAIAAYLNVYLHWGTWPSVGVALAIGIVIGVWQAAWIAYALIPAFVVTLGGQMIFRGALIMLTKGQTIAPLSDSFNDLGGGYLPRLFLKGDDAPFHDTTAIIWAIVLVVFIILELRSRQKKIGFGFKVLEPKQEILKIVMICLVVSIPFAIMTFYLGMPWSIVIVLSLVAIFTFLTNNTTFGRQVYAIGGNKEAARLSGINIKSRNFLVFVIMGGLSALAGVVFTGRVGAGAASSGQDFELQAIAAAYIGGSSTMGGEGTIIGAIVGALVMACLNNGIGLMGLNVDWQKMITGLILLLAVWFDIASKKKNA